MNPILWSDVVVDGFHAAAKRVGLVPEAGAAGIAESFSTRGDVESERVQARSEPKSRQYWRMPACMGKNEKTKFSWQRRPSGWSATEREISGRIR